MKLATLITGCSHTMGGVNVLCLSLSLSLSRSFTHTHTQKHSQSTVCAIILDHREYFALYNFFFFKPKCFLHISNHLHLHLFISPSSSIISPCLPLFLPLFCELGQQLVQTCAAGALSRLFLLKEAYIMVINTIK